MLQRKVIFNVSLLLLLICLSFQTIQWNSDTLHASTRKTHEIEVDKSGLDLSILENMDLRDIAQETFDKDKSVASGSTKNISHIEHDSSCAQDPECLVQLQIIEKIYGILDLKFDSGIHVCDQDGIACNENDSVAHIRLGGANISGTIPTELGSLMELESILFENNALTGSIPSELGELKLLHQLVLSGNELTGSIPSALENNDNLQYLFLASNKMRSQIPSEIGKLHNLIRLELDRNGGLYDTIPTEIGLLTHLEWFTTGLQQNELKGTLPTELGNLSSLEVLAIDHGRLTGAIPSELGMLTSIKQFYIEHNDMKGTIPTEIGNLEHCWDFQVEGNALTGPIPSELGNLGRLATPVEFDYGIMTVPRKLDLGKLSNLCFFS